MSVQITKYNYSFTQQELEHYLEEVLDVGQVKTSVRFAANHRTTLDHVRERRTPQNICRQQRDGARVFSREACKVPLEFLHDLFVHWPGFRGGEDVDPPARNLTEEDLLGKPGLRGISPINWTTLEDQISEFVNG